MTNAKRLPRALPLLLTVVFGLAACGGGGGGGGSSSSGGSGGGSGTVPRPQCSKAAALDPGNVSYNFLVPSEDASSGKITLINANNFSDTRTPASNGSAASGSAAVAQSGKFTAGSGRTSAQITNLKPRYLVYVNGGDVYRENLDPNASNSLTRLTSGLNIGEICNAKIVTRNIGDASGDYYLYSTPASGNACQDSAQDDAHLLSIGGTGYRTPTTVDNANPIEALGNPADGTLLAFVASDSNNDLNYYDVSYQNKQGIGSFGAAAGYSDIYNVLDLAYIRVIPVTGNDHLIRVQATGNGQVTSNIFNPNPSGGGQVSAHSADDNYLYYAVQAGSGYIILKVKLTNKTPSTNHPTVVTSGGQPGAVATSLEVTDTKLVFLVRDSSSATTGKLVAVDKSATGSGQVQTLDTNVVYGYPIFSAGNRLYYTVVSGSDLEAKIIQDDGNGIADYKKSAWFSSTLPSTRPAGGSDPDHILLAAGYTGSPNTLAGSILDSFSTDSNTSCVTFNHGVNATPFVTQRFGPVGTGTVGSTTGPRFAFDASDGRFVQIP